MAATELLDKLKNDNDDIIQYLQRSLKTRDDQCVELKERLKGLQLVKRIFGFSVQFVPTVHVDKNYILIDSNRLARKKVKTMNDD